MAKSRHIVAKFPQIAFAVLLFFRLCPYFIWGILSQSYSFQTLIDFIIIAFAFCNTYTFRGKKLFITDSDTLLFIIFAIATFVHTIVNGGSIFGFLAMSSFVFLGFLNKDYVKDVLVIFTKIYTIILSLSFVSWILANIGLMPSMGIIDHYSEPRQYDHYPLCISEAGLLINIRFYGVFYEPGLLGTVNALLLFINQFNMKNWKNIILLITGLCTFSMFFYLVAFCYLVYYFAFIRKKSWFVCLLIILPIIAYYATKDNLVISELLWQRIEWDKNEHRFSGDNRSLADGGIDISDYYNSIKGTSEYWWGVKDKQGFKDYVAGSCTYKSIIAVSGIVYFVLFCSFFVLYGLIHPRNKKEILFYFFLFGSVMYQRPFEYNAFWIFIMCACAKFSLGSGKEVVV